MQNLVALLAGLLFGLGLILSGMTDPTKIQGFLDLGGTWDPSLAVVMAGAILVAAPAFAVARRRSRSLLDNPMRLPTSQTIDAQLVWGSVAFGAGWGLAGFCPGPALISASAGSVQASIFVAAMLAGMLLYAILNRYSKWKP
jgi:uncharacterized membrane protein YedE/YeeE